MSYTECPPFPNKDEVFTEKTPHKTATSNTAGDLKQEDKHQIKLQGAKQLQQTVEFSTQQTACSASAVVGCTVQTQSQ